MWGFFTQDPFQAIKITPPLGPHRIRHGNGQTVIAVNIFWTKTIPLSLLTHFHIGLEYIWLLPSPPTILELYGWCSAENRFRYCLPQGAAPIHCQTIGRFWFCKHMCAVPRHTQSSGRAENLIDIVGKSNSFRQSWLSSWIWPRCLQVGMS